jgi:hypothetical protein
MQEKITLEIPTPGPGDQVYHQAKPNTAGKYRAHGYKNRVWIAIPIEEINKLEEDTIMKIRNSSGETEEVLACELLFSKILQN